MSSVLFVLVPLMFALLVKLAAWLNGRLRLPWLHAFGAGLLLLLVIVCLRFVIARPGDDRSYPFASTAVVVLMQAALAGWYLGLKARTVHGMPIRFSRGVLLALIAIGLAVGVGLLYVAVALFLPGFHVHAVRPIQ